MKLLSIIDGLGTGGAERSLVEIAVGMVAAGHDVEVVCLHRRHGAHEDLVDAGVAVSVLRAGRFVPRVREFRRIVRTRRPDAVHSTLYDSNLVARFALIGLGVPLVTSLVNVKYDVDRLELLRGPQRIKYRAARQIDRLSARPLTTHFHAITQAVADDLASDYRIPRSAITVIARGRSGTRFAMGTEFDRTRVRRSLGVGDEILILSLGRQETQKGQIYLLEAAARMTASTGRARIMIGGREGSETQRLTEHLEQSVAGCAVEFLGFRRDVPELLLAADIFVFPSLWEGLGGALIEAMAAGLPIVASDLPAVREVVVDDHNAKLVPARDGVALAAELEALVGDPDERARLGANSRLRFLSMFESDLINRQMAALFKSVSGIAAEEREAVES